MIARTMPDNSDPKERAKEQRLKRIARKGVVQLFNAVREHQQQLDYQKVGNIQQRTADVDETKQNFESLLKKKKVDDEEDEGEKLKSKWSALQADTTMKKISTLRVFNIFPMIFSSTFFAYGPQFSKLLFHGYSGG